VFGGPSGILAGRGRGRRPGNRRARLSGDRDVGVLRRAQVITARGSLTRARYTTAKTVRSGAPTGGPARSFARRNFSKSCADMDDIWHVMGCAGTGSRQFRFERLIWPEALCGRDDGARREDGGVYGSAACVYALGFAGVDEGIAAAPEAFIGLARDMVPFRGKRHLRRTNNVPVRSREAAKHACAPPGFLYGSIEEITGEVDRAGQITPRAAVMARSGGLGPSRFPVDERRRHGLITPPDRTRSSKRTRRARSRHHTVSQQGGPQGHLDLGQIYHRLPSDRLGIGYKLGGFPRPEVR